MKTKMKQMLVALFATVTLAVGAGGAASALTIQDGADAARDESQQSACLFDDGSAACEGETPLFQVITNVLLFIIGAVSVVMLIIGGIRYTVSQGDSSAVTGAKNTILYSIVGLVISILAYAVVNFVIGNFVKSDEETTSLGVTLG
jgi:hypothetical protein